MVPGWEIVRILNALVMEKGKGGDAHGCSGCASFNIDLAFDIWLFFQCISGFFFRFVI